MIQPTILNKNNRTTNASSNPMLRANLFFSEGNLSVTIEIKIMLSIPSTISNKESTTR